jgi:cation transporter-like permease
MIISVVNILLYLIVVGLLGGLAYYIVDAVPIPQPFNKLIKLAVIVVCVLIVILLLLQLAGSFGGVRLPTVVTYDLGAAVSSSAT